MAMAGLFGFFRRKESDEEPEPQLRPAEDRTPAGSEARQAPPASGTSPQGPAAPGHAAPDAGTEPRFHATPVVQSAQPAAEAPASPALSPLDALMQDAVVMALVQEGVVTMPQALVALRQQTNVPGASLWRTLAAQAGVDRDAVYAEAARVQGFETAHISEKKPTDELVDAVRGLFPPQVGERMFALGLLPFEFLLDPATRRHSLVFATHDPTHPDVAAFCKSLGVASEVRYAPAALVAERVRRIRMREGAAAQQPAPQSAQQAAAQPEKAKQAPVRPVELPKAVEDVPEAADFEDGDGPHGRHPAGSPGGFSLDDLVRLIQPDTVPDIDTLVEDRIEPARTDNLSGDGHLNLERTGAGESEGAADNPTPALGLTGWTGSATPPPPPPENPEGEGDASAPDGPVDVAGLEAARKDRVVAMLLRKEIVTTQQVGAALERQKKERSKEALWRIVAAQPNVDREAIYAEAARVYAFPAARIGDGQPDPEFARSVIDTFTEERRGDLLRLKVLPIECDLEQQTGAIKLVFITHDPTRPEVHRLMQQLKLERFELRYAPESVVSQALQLAFPKKNEYLERMSSDPMAFDLGMNYDEKSGLIDEDALEAEISRSSLINLFEATLVEAVRQGCSDVHIYPNAEKKIEIHFRIDGRLVLWHVEDKVHPEALLAVIKDNATNVDRFERDAAQDGFIQRWIDESLIRFRVSVLPIANALQEMRSESIVIRVLDDRKVITDLKKLGLLPTAMERFSSAIRQPHGMVILTGPTGSGKSTTLVAALHQVVSPEVNVLTVEDPVEYIIPGVRQIKLNHKLGLEEALRSILRHDPDVVMVGEMRDKQTAELAIKLANTGHLTFSTLHTNDAPAAVSRLYKMGVEPFLIAYAINLVVAQRLIRLVCPACKTPDPDPDHVMLHKLGFTDEEIATLPFYIPGHDPNCKVCKGMGYRGRRAVTEALYFSRNIRHLIVESDKSINEDAIRDLAIKEGMLTLADSAREVVKMGETTVQEMIRVVTTEF